ncbi:MAG: DUF1292 domain-containing protein [Lachnospiraceae bacterium]|nr:DUF1292 domain-containing protein [Lachnospiraceae bacterium]
MKDYDFEDDYEVEEEDLVVTLPLEDGTELECDVVVIFELAGQDYVALYPTSGEPDEIYLMRCRYDGGEDMELEEITDEKEYQDVCDTFDDIMQEQEIEDLIDGNY